MRGWVGLVVMLLATWPTCARADAIEANLRRDVAAIVQADDRAVGSTAARQATEVVAGRLAEAAGQPVWRQRFLMVVPEVAECTAAILNADGTVAGNVPIAPLGPMGGQCAALPGKEATADVIYAGKGTLAELNGKTVAGNWVAMEISSDANAWQTIASLGARGVIFVGGPQTGAQAFLDKTTSSPVGLPRFYCDEPASVAAFRGEKFPQLKIRVYVRWTEKEVENLLCLIPGRQTTANLPFNRSGWTEQLVVLQTRLDASSQVMGRAPGAEQAGSVAAVLRVAEGLAKAPDRCSVLVAMTAGDEWQFRGTRMLEDLLRPDLKTAAKAASDLEQAQAKLRSTRDAATLLIANLEKLSQGDLTALKQPAAHRVIRDQLSREASQVEEQLEHARLMRARAEIDALSRQKESLVAATGSILGYRSTEPASEIIITKAAGTALPVWRREFARLEQNIAARAPWSQIRKSIGERLPLVHFDVALTSHGQQFGFFSRSTYFWQYDQTGKMSEYGTALRRYWNDAHGKDAGGFFHADSTTGQYPFSTFFPIKRGFSSDAVLVRGTPAGCFATEFDNSGIMDTPGDRLDRVDFAALAAQARDLEALLLGTSGAANKPGALTDPRFYGRSELSNIVTDQPLRLLERTLGETTPRLAAAEVLVGGEHEKDRDGRGNPGPMQGTRRFDWYLSHPFIGINDDDASVVLGSLQRWEFRVHALDFDADGIPVRCIVANTNDQRGIVHRFTPDANRPARTMLFDCQRLNLFGLFDPRYMEYLDKIDLLDARRLDKAQFSNVYVQNGVAAVFMPPDLRWQLLVSKGDVTNRMILLNAPPPQTGAAGGAAATDPEAGEAKGFTTTDLSQIGPLSWRTANDFYALNARRKANLEQYGISNQVVDDLQTRTKVLLDAGAAAREQRDYVTWMASAAGAWSLQEQAYATLITTSNGIIKGVIFLLLGIIPFSYFLERLLIGATNVYKQIGWFALIFAVMTAALLGHPAFRISSAPLMILLAFLILILSSTVIYILWGKFEEEIARLRGAGSAAHSTSLRRGAVFGAAIRLGLSNMRRRGMRTTLTLVTLVLLTFTLLCFTSVRDTLVLTPRLVDDAPHQAPAGILLRQRGWKTLPPPVLQMAREIADGLGTHSKTGGVISERWWYASEKPEGIWRLPVSAADASAAPTGEDTTFYATGLVGILPTEQYFQAADLTKLLPGWERLAAGEAVCFLPEDARALGVGTRVKVLGETLIVAGFYNADKVQTQLKHLTGDELMPTDPSSNAQSGPGSTQSTAAEELATLPELTYRYLSARTVAIIPAAVAQRLGARLTSVMVRPGTEGPVAASRPETQPETSSPPTATLPTTSPIITLAEDISRRSAFTVYVSDGVNPVVSINSVESTRPQNLQKVLVPLIIAGVIVLNTMLGAVAERTREIHVYTSVGLAPSHVGMLFLAEAAALGTLGVVFGYVFGQGLATVLSHTHLISGIDLNYSSMAAVFTMALVLGLVMLSSLWPARAATRVAAPSLQRDWKLPAPQGDLLKVELPFTVNQVAAKGVCAFLEEFMLTASQMGGAGGGRFTADQVRTFECPVECPVSSVQCPEPPASSPPLETGNSTLDTRPPSPQLETGNWTLDTRSTLDTRPVVRGLACRIWLAPYDLGVIQSFWLAIHPTADAHVFEVRLTLLREAGNPGTWFRLNRPFLVEIRKQFLLWRSVRTEQIEDYVARSQVMFEHAEPKLPPQ